MRIHLFILLFGLCLVFVGQAQDTDGVVSFNLPVRNSLTFNRYALNPTFSFVREQTKFISVTNKREWVQFEDNPETYLASFAGRFAENIGAGFGLFQQNYGVLTTFGGVLNFAYNAKISRDTNLTFGLNLGAYQSGINTSNVVTTVPDPSLQNVPTNFLMTVNPGVNFGTRFLDFGVSVNNLALYNFSDSSLIEDNPDKSFQLHAMYTGFISNRGFLNDAKFSALLRTEFFEEETIISGVTMLTLPLGLWAQAGYNTVYGASGGVGLNITEQIAIEYNFENPVGDLSAFGPSHEITLAYRFKPNRYLDYSNDEEVAGLFSTDKRFKKRRARSSSSSRENRTVLTPQERAEAVRKAQEERAARALALEQRAKDQEEAKTKRIAEQKSQTDAVKEADIVAAQKAAEAAEAKRIAEQKAKDEANSQAEAKRIAEQKAQDEANRQAEIIAAQKAAEAKRIAEQKTQDEANRQAEAKRIAEQKAQDEAIRQAEIIAAQAAEAKRIAEQEAQDEANRQAEAKRIAEQKAQDEAIRQAEIIAAQKAAEAVEAKRIAEQKSKEEADVINNPKDLRSQQMLDIAKKTEQSSVAQENLLKALDSLVAVKDNDLKALKEENDLSEQGIAVQPRQFKSITAENNRLNSLKSELDTLIKDRNDQISELEKLYEEALVGDTLTNDVVMLHYRKKIKRLQAEQVKASETRAAIDTELERIRLATEYERRRRIKRASFDTDEQRYQQDRAMLKNIKSSTALSKTVYTEKDFDFGENLGDNIKILKNINKVDNGYYMIIAVHNNIDRLKAFLTKVVASGRKDVDFFYDVNTSKYYIYYDKHSDIGSATEALGAKGDRPYNRQMSIVKIEN